MWLRVANLHLGSLTLRMESRALLQVEHIFKRRLISYVNLSSAQWGTELAKPCFRLSVNISRQVFLVMPINLMQPK